MSPYTTDIGTYIGYNLSVRKWAPGEGVDIGKYCSIADNVTFLCGGAHRSSLVSTYPWDVKLLGKDDKESRTYKSSPRTHVGHDVWIASHATIMPGLRIGTGAIVQAWSVVFDDVPPYAVVRGNPAKIIRYRHRDWVREGLLNSQWWDWPEDIIRARVNELYASPESFVRKYGRLE